MSAFLSRQSRDKVTKSLQTTSLPYYREAWWVSGDRTKWIISKGFSFMQGLDVMLIRNTAFVDFAQQLFYN